MMFSPAEKGQGLVEYALFLALVVIVVMVVLVTFGTGIGNTFNRINTSVSGL